MLCFEVEDNGLECQRSFWKGSTIHLNRRTRAEGVFLKGRGLTVDYGKSGTPDERHICVQSERGGSLFMVNLPLGRTEQKGSNETFLLDFITANREKAGN